MRGLTMLLVVYDHLSLLFIGNPTLRCEIYDYWIFNNLFREFRMPLFFFVSGFVLYKASRIWNFPEIKSFFKKKLPVQLLFPFVCMCCCLWVTGMHTFDEAIFKSDKGGYWFTFVLLEYYAMYIILELIPLKGKWKDIMMVAAGCCVVLFALGFRHIIPVDIATLLSIPHWKFFIYLVLGVLAHKHFPKFERIMDNDIVIIACIAMMLVVNILNHGQLILGLPGVLLVFAFFRHYQATFTEEHALGRVMQYVGRHTLDIYLLHWFFMPGEGLAAYRQYFCGSAMLQLVCTLICSAVVIAMTLVISNVLRLSPFIAHYCFGAKKTKQ